jgi:hypothetical protein
MEIPPRKADLAQISRGRHGEMVLIENDVQGVANSLAEIDPHLRLRFSEAGEYFVVYWKPDDEPEGNGELVTTALDLDMRIVELVRELYWKAKQPGYSFADELAAEQERRQAVEGAKFTEEHGEMFERLAHAMRKDLGYDKGRVFVPDV